MSRRSSEASGWTSISPFAGYVIGLQLGTIPRQGNSTARTGDVRYGSTRKPRALEASGASWPCLGGRNVLPVARAFVCKGMNKEVDEGAHLRLGEPAGRIDGIDALRLDRQIGNDILDQPILHRLGIKKAGKIRDPESGNGGIEKRLPVIHRQPARGADLTFLAGRCRQRSEERRVG